MSVWQGLHKSPWLAPSARAKLCTYFHWLAQPDRVLVEPYFELPRSFTKLRLLFQFRMGSHLLPVEQGRSERPGVPRTSRSCTFSPNGASDDERHRRFYCPRFSGHPLSFARLFDDAHSAISVAQRPGGCLCSHIGHLYR